MNSLSQLNTFSATPVEFFDGRTNTTTTSAYRYAFNGVVSTDKTVMQNLEAMANACGSWVSYDAHDGKWSVVINKSDASIASFNNSNIIGSLTVNGTDINELYNQVKCQFPHIDLNDNPDYINIEIPEGERNANEPINSLEMQFDILNDPVQAQLIGAINLKQSRVDKVVRFTTDYSKLGLKAGHIIDITSDIYGFVNKKFRITSLNEQDTDDGNIVLDITALEYDDTVYSTADLYRYPVTNSTGIIGIGTIGKPGLPEVVKTEVASLPKITVTSTAPTGIVEEMEFWYTRDVPPGNNVDATRSYSLLGRVKPTNGTTFAFGTAVSLDVSTLGTGNFLIKSRGVNATTAGQYSDPSGVVYYAPVQTTDAIGPETSLIDETGGLIGTLALTYLLNNLDQLFKGNVSVGSIFDQIFGLFKDETGTDIVAQATANVSALGISRDGSPLTSTTGNLDFRGTAITSVGVTGNDVSITFDSPTIGISNNGNVVTTSTGNINFTGNGITSISSVGDDVTINIAGGGGGGTANVIANTSATSNLGLTTDTINGNTYLNSNLSIKTTANAAAKGLSVTNIGGGQWQINFDEVLGDAPYGYPGTLITQYCEGKNLVGQFSTGNSTGTTTYTQILQTDCKTCGGNIAPPHISSLRVRMYEGVGDTYFSGNVKMNPTNDAGIYLHSASNVTVRQSKSITGATAFNGTYNPSHSYLEVEMSRSVVDGNPMASIPAGRIPISYKKNDGTFPTGDTLIRLQYFGQWSNGIGSVYLGREQMVLQFSHSAANNIDYLEFMISDSLNGNTGVPNVTGVKYRNGVGTWYYRL